MPSNRKVVLANGEYYHIFNRGVEKRRVFLNAFEFSRATQLLEYYRFADVPLRYSKYLSLEKQKRQELLGSLQIKNVEIVAFCLMDNHFHVLVQQISDQGISKFMANFTNGYTKYFNTKHDRVGPLFQGAFKSVHVSGNEQLLHVSRYIHLNPVLAFKMTKEGLKHYRWSSYPVYIGKEESEWIQKDRVLDFFAKRDKQKDYEKFVLDQSDYAQSLKTIEHLTID